MGLNKVGIGQDTVHLWQNYISIVARQQCLNSGLAKNIDHDE